jgi:hypothetical protein
MYSNLKTYINLKGMIGMPITSRHVWGHAYKHDTCKKTVLSDFRKGPLVFNLIILMIIDGYHIMWYPSWEPTHPRVLTLVNIKSKN